MEWFSKNLPYLLAGVSVGGQYALIAIGYTMVYGILRLINFAHGDIFMIGAYLTYYGIVYTSIPWYIIFILVPIVTGILGIVLEKCAYKPLREAPKITVLISAIGASFLLQNLGILVFGGRPKAFPTPAIFKNAINIGGVTISYINFIIPLVTVILLIGLNYFVQKTRTGMAMRAL